MTEPSGYRRTLPLLAACLLALAIPLPFTFGSVGVIGVVATAVLLCGKILFRNLRHRKLLWLPLALYGWTLASALWSHNGTETSHILSTKLPLLLLPLAIGCSDLYEEPSRRRVMTFLTLGVAAVGAYCMWTSYSHYRVDGDVQGLFYHRLVAGLSANAVYMAWYAVTAILFLLLEPLKLRGRRGTAAMFLRGGALLLLLAFFLMLAARTLLLLFMVAVLPVILIRSFGRKMPLPQKILTWAFVGAVALALGVAARQPAIQARFRELGESRPELSFLKRYKGEENTFSNMNVRLFLWRIGLENMGASPQTLLLGTGVGDAKEAINQSIRDLGIPNMEKDHPERSAFYNINLHNTFLHTALATGLPGLLLAIAMAGTLLRLGIRQFSRRPFLFFFAALSVAFMMQEAVFETQAGTVFYTLVYSVFVSGLYSERRSGSLSAYPRARMIP